MTEAGVAACAGVLAIVAGIFGALWALSTLVLFLGMALAANQAVAGRGSLVRTLVDAVLGGVVPVILVTQLAPLAAPFDPHNSDSKVQLVVLGLGGMWSLFASTTLLLFWLVQATGQLSADLAAGLSGRAAPRWLARPPGARAMSLFLSAGFGAMGGIGFVASLATWTNGGSMLLTWAASQVALSLLLLFSARYAVALHTHVPETMAFGGIAWHLARRILATLAGGGAALASGTGGAWLVGVAWLFSTAGGADAGEIDPQQAAYLELFFVLLIPALLLVAVGFLLRWSNSKVSHPGSAAPPRSTAA